MGASPEQAAEMLEDAGTIRFRVDEADTAWLVAAGSVDLFLVPVEPGHSPGARHHVMRAREGEVLFGVRTPPQFPAMLLAVATPGSRVSTLPRTSIDELWSDDAGVRLLESWVASLSRTVLQAVPPKSVDLMDAGPAVAVRETGVLLPREGLLWVKLRVGSARFAGAALPAPVDDIFFPLSQHAWIDAEPGTEMLACRTREVGSPEALDRGLQTFHAAVLEGLVRNLQASNEREAARVSRRRSSDRAHVDYAMRLLSSPLQREAGVGDLAEINEDPWFLACAAVGRHAGIAFRPSPDKVLRQTDPVRAIARSSGVRSPSRVSGGARRALRCSDAAGAIGCPSRSSPTPPGGTASTTRSLARPLRQPSRQPRRSTPSPGSSTGRSRRRGCRRPTSSGSA
jgi:hypothetical protein